ncbi:hypothetical protein ACH518_14940 [Methylomonas sp. HW2-6]|uniref:hypothetical protein n=1 Tax=Methylomonas sp. HW2-6 TaxID=3376687 RepID=UPI0040414E59
MVLSLTEENGINVAGRGYVVSSLQRLVIQQNPNWLSNGHKLRNGVNAKHAPGKSKHASDDEIAEYLATSAPTHCLNGWSYLSRALSSLTAGDPHSAWHFAYYAELRAALSILAASGIGVFNEWNSVIDSSGLLIKIDEKDKPVKGTHSMAWLALKQWVKHNPEARQSLERAISFRSCSLGDAITQLSLGTTGYLCVYKWLTEWAFDISMGTQDRKHRNAASYTPHEFFSLQISTKELYDYISEFWFLLEPQSGGAFYQLDRYLFRVALLDTINSQPKSINSPSIPPIVAGYRRLDPTIQNHLPLEFLKRQSDPSDPSVFQYAKQTKNPPTSPLTILSRATLLLRISTGIVSRLFFDAGIPKNYDLDFWFSPFGVQRGFWNSGDEPSSMMDLWTDVDESLHDFSDIFQNGSHPSHKDLLNNQNNGFPHIWEAERAALWCLST